MRVLLDSNVWLAILTTDGFCRRVWREARHSCVFFASRDILDEIAEKLRAKFGFSPRHARLMVSFVKEQTRLARILSTVGVCRDADDNRILAAALDAGCSQLVTGDSDLLVLKKFETVNVATPREFLNLVSAA
ncbi:MAG: putative toxin-antitoxin system toxin component, PIN family [Verrucomicrobia bacterium]|nr:putative toxin-antitoxin system toxin component, PIN family [Verrucomicrobiota bacterium]